MADVQELREKEIEYCNNRNVQKYQSFAGRFAAKEAIFKALSECLDNKFEVEWKDIEIVNDNAGKPMVNLYGKFADIECKIDVSISHITDIAIANCVVVF